MSFNYSTGLTSLEERSLVNLVLQLWTNQDHDLLSLINRLSDVMPDMGYTGRIIDFLLPDIFLKIRSAKQWSWLKKSASDLIKKLPLPSKFETTLVFIFLHLGWELFCWREYHKNIVDESYIRKNLYKVFYTSIGTIDKKKTAELLVKDENLSVYDRFKLACVYCIEDTIHTLWEQIDERFKSLEYIHSVNFPLIYFWSHVKCKNLTFFEEDEKPFCHLVEDVPSQYAFRHSVFSGNEVATEYFYKFLTDEQKKNIIKDATIVVVALNFCYIGTAKYPTKFYPELILFLLSVLNEEQKMSLFQKHSSDVLSHFTFWPWIEQQKKLLEYMLTFIDDEQCHNILVHFIYYIRENHTHDIYLYYFENFWDKVPARLKRGYFQEFNFICQPFNLYNEKLIKIIFKHATPLEKANFLHSHCGLKVLNGAISKKRRDIFDMVVNECLSTEEEILAFNNLFQNYCDREREKFKKTRVRVIETNANKKRKMFINKRLCNS